jgi:hypothetical protein
VSVETETGGSGVRLPQGRGAASIAYSHGHQSHQMAPGSVALPAPLAESIGVAVMRSFTGGRSSIGPGSDGIGTVMCGRAQAVTFATANRG